VLVSRQLLSRLFLVGLLSLGALSAEALETLLDQAARSDDIADDVRYLCDAIGPRLPGTDAMDAAEEWTAQRFRDAGVDAVRLEPFSVPLTWREGETRIEVLTPTPFAVKAVSTAWSPPVRRLEAPLLDARNGSAFRIRQWGDEAQGKILLVELDEAQTFHTLGIEQRDAIVALREAAAVGAAAVLFSSTRPNRLLYRHVHTVTADLDPIPSAVLTREDALRLQRLLRDGRELTVRLRMPNRSRGPVEARNVVARIEGSEKPEEVVLLGAHLDSWDLGTGCLDNAVNVGVVLEAARAIAAGKRRPRRTIEFALFGAEEVGLIGSLAYVRAHRDELDDYAAVLVHDMGLGAVQGYSVNGRSELKDPLREALAPLGQLGGQEGIDEAFFGSDHFDFLLEGVPALIAIQDTEAYAPAYHSAADTYDKVDEHALRERARFATGAAFALADAPERLGVRLSRDEIARLLARTSLDDQLKFLGIWDSWQSGERGRALVAGE